MLDVYKVVSDNLEYKDILSFRLVDHFHNHIFLSHWIYKPIILKEYNIKGIREEYFPEWLRECKLVLYHCIVNSLSFQFLPDIDFHCCKIYEPVIDDDILLTIQHIIKLKEIYNIESEFNIFFCKRRYYSLCAEINEFTKYHQILEGKEIKVDDLNYDPIKDYRIQNLVSTLMDLCEHQDSIYIIILIIFCFEVIDRESVYHPLLQVCINKIVEIREIRSILYNQYKEVLDYIQEELCG